MKLILFAHLIALALGLSFAAWISPHAVAADAPTVEIVANLPPGQPIGTTITWTASTTISEPVAYRLALGLAGEPPHVMYDFSARRAFAWTPLDEGAYVISVTARNRALGVTAAASTTFTIAARATDAPLITATDHPLVALYSAPPCPAGDFVRVWFTPADRFAPMSTDRKPCHSDRSANFYIAGLYADTDYKLRHEILDGAGAPTAYGSLLRHHTGVVTRASPVNIVLPMPPPDPSPYDPVLLLSPTYFTSTEPAFPYAVDTAGQLLWYYDRAMEPRRMLYRPVAGGTFLVSANDETMQILREVDLAGHTVRETTAARLSEQLPDLGQDRIGAFHHEAVRLPDGRTAALLSVERMLSLEPGQEPVDVLGDYIVVLDEDWQVVWSWNSFDHLDVQRTAGLREWCVSMGPGCPPLFLADEALDWTHGNTITYSPADGNLLVSLRHQDWVIKIDYRDGAGTGDVVWRLGPGGDFVLTANDPYPWFTHQHDPQFVAENALVIYDNGNTRCLDDENLCYSRGQVYVLNETARIAALTLNVDLDNFSYALGSAQRLRNGNFHFNSGIHGPQDARIATADEVRPDGSKAYRLLTRAIVYRSFRLADLYTAPGQGEIEDLTRLIPLLGQGIYLPLMARAP